MRKLPTLVTAAVTGLVFAQPGFAQPGPYGPRGVPHGQFQQHGPQRPPGGQYYYNGRWVDAGEWQRHNSEREHWAHDYQHHRGHGDDDSSAALLAGIIGFALGAAIVGSQQQAEHARSADQSWDAYCARKYRSYDPRSRTYLGLDGLRHYCQ